MLYQCGLADRTQCSQDEKSECKAYVAHLLTLACKSHKDGLLSLEDDIKEMPRSFLCTLLQLGVSGTTPEIIREAMEKRLLLSDRSGVDLMRSLIELEFVIEIVNNRDPATIQTKLYGLLDIDPDGFQSQEQ